jgi:hypothetical protein
MKNPPAPMPAPAASRSVPAVLLDGSKALRSTRALIYIYLLLLVLEGALRKWVVPQLSNPLLIIRDPVVLLIYIFALRARCFRWNGFVVAVAILGVLSWIAGVVVLLDYFPPKTVLLVTVFGVRSNFLHLPLIFVIAAALDYEDVKRLGWWTILGLIPMAALMAWQFHAAPEAFVNRTAGVGEGTQILTSGGKIRPPGPFSFVSGAIFYLSVAAAFLLHAMLSKLPYKTWVLYSAAIGLLVAIGVSGSRGAVLAVALVVASLGVILVVRPDAMTKLGRNILVAVVLLWAVSHVPIFRQGVGILSQRFTESAEVAETSVVGGLLARVFEGFAQSVIHTPQAPWLGYGLGVGTNGGSAFLMGHSAFLLTEDEWTRIVFESGPILGWLFVLWRVILTFNVGIVSYRALKAGNTLPILLFGAAFFAILNAPLGQPTSAGFAVILAGLCLSAARQKHSPAETAAPELRPPPTLRGRSIFAARLHERPLDQANGSVDR